MIKTLSNKRILLGVSGSIAAYKSPDIVRRLQDLGAEVRVILTEGGAQFITELSLQAVSGHKVHHNLWDQEMELSMGHIELAKWADAILIAPASANTLAKLSAGKADDLLSSVILASEAKLLLAPAMNQQMYASSAVKDNLATLQERSAQIIKPDYGEQACGDVGEGRLAEPVEIAKQVGECFGSTALSGKHVLITLGATMEAIDPVRFISNHSSGKMGSAIANSCIEHGASVSIIHGNIATTLNDRARKIQALSANEMYEQVMNNIDQADLFISVAAVSDYTVKSAANQKIKKNGKPLTLELVPGKDILKSVCALENKPLCIGFAAETENLIENAQKKLKNKGCDAIILNDVSQADLGFQSEDNEVFFISEKISEKIGKNSKQKVAEKICQICIREFL